LIFDNKIANANGMGLMNWWLCWDNWRDAGWEGWRGRKLRYR